MKTRIVITFSFPALHCYPNNPNTKTHYLKHPHRHVFYVEMKKNVSNDVDRDVEFIAFKEAVLGFVRHRWEGKNMENTSCELIAKILSQEFACDYVKVMEDNENGAEVER